MTRRAGKLTPAASVEVAVSTSSAPDGLGNTQAGQLSDVVGRRVLVPRAVAAVAAVAVRANEQAQASCARQGQPTAPQPDEKPSSTTVRSWCVRPAWWYATPAAAVGHTQHTRDMSTHGGGSGSPQGDQTRRSAPRRTHTQHAHPAAAQRRGLSSHPARCGAAQSGQHAQQPLQDPARPRGPAAALPARARSPGMRRGRRKRQARCGFLPQPACSTRGWGWVSG
jgi:hypothetical protein